MSLYRNELERGHKCYKVSSKSNSNSSKYYKIKETVNEYSVLKIIYGDKLNLDINNKIYLAN